VTMGKSITSTLGVQLKIKWIINESLVVTIQSTVMFIPLSHFIFSSVFFFAKSFLIFSFIPNLSHLIKHVFFFLLGGPFSTLVGFRFKKVI
jgi:hypothetical protein